MQQDAYMQHYCVLYPVLVLCKFEGSPGHDVHLHGRGGPQIVDKQGHFTPLRQVLSSVPLDGVYTLRAMHIHPSAVTVYAVPHQ